MARTRSVFSWPTGEERAGFLATGAATGWQALAEPGATPGRTAPDTVSHLSCSGSAAGAVERLTFAYDPGLAADENIVWVRLWVHAAAAGGASLRAHIQSRSRSERLLLGGFSETSVEVRTPVNAPAAWYASDRLPARRSDEPRSPIAPRGRLYAQLQNASAGEGNVTVHAVAIELGISTMSLAHIDRRGISEWGGGNVVPVYGIQYGGDGALGDPVNPGWGCWWEQQDVTGFLTSMRSWGWNTLRVGLPMGMFMKDRVTPDVTRFRALAEFLDHCERHDIRTILTGQLWNPTIRDRRGWGLDSLDEAGRWAWRQLFWFTLAKHCGYSPTILLYDLASECGFATSTVDLGTWYSVELSGYNFGEWLTRTTLNHSPPTEAQAALDFVATMTDPRTGITACDVTPRTSVGRLFPDGGWSQADIEGRTHAFMPHIYPLQGGAGEALAEWLVANRCWGELPVVLEESGNLLGALPEELIEMWAGISPVPDAPLAGSLTFAPSYLTPANAMERRDRDSETRTAVLNAFTYLRAMPLAMHQQDQQLLPRAAQRICARAALQPRCCQRI